MTTSVIIPAFNAARYLAETINSVVAQSTRDWELIIVDDGSTDDTATIAQAYAQGDARIRLIQQPNSGVSRARNRGIEEVSPASLYLAFLDADDVWELDTLETLVAASENLPNSVGSHGLARLINENSQPILLGVSVKYVSPAATADRETSVADPRRLPDRLCLTYRFRLYRRAECCPDAPLCGAGRQWL